MDKIDKVLTEHIINEVIKNVIKNDDMYVVPCKIYKQTTLEEIKGDNFISIDLNKISGVISSNDPNACLVILDGLEIEVLQDYDNFTKIFTEWKKKKNSK